MGLGQGQTPCATFPELQDLLESVWGNWLGALESSSPHTHFLWLPVGQELVSIPFGPLSGLPKHRAQ